MRADACMAEAMGMAVEGDGAIGSGSDLLYALNWVFHASVMGF